MKHAAGAAVFCPTCLSAAAALASVKGAAPPWSYEGASGPEQWGELSPAFRVCDLGVQQSPIDLVGGVRAGVGKIDVNYRTTALNVVNNGHTIQVNCDPGSFVVLDGRAFQLLQYHFHHPSEHLLSGKAFDLEAHFVHAADDGTLAVLAVFVEQGGRNEALARIWNVMPRETGEAQGGTADPAALLPAERGYFRYLGSLTTPPCSQTVIWSVFRNPVAMSSRQARRFASIFPANVRPVQPLNRRMLLKSL